MTKQIILSYVNIGGHNSISVEYIGDMSQQEKMQLLEALERDLCGESYQELEERLSLSEAEVGKLADELDDFVNGREEDYISYTEFL